MHDILLSVPSETRKQLDSKGKKKVMIKDNEDDKPVVDSNQTKENDKSQKKNLNPEQFLQSSS